MKTRIKDVLWFCVICERVIEGKANEEAVCKGWSAQVKRVNTPNPRNPEEPPIELFTDFEVEEHIPIEMEAR